MSKVLYVVSAIGLGALFTLILVGGVLVWEKWQANPRVPQFQPGDLVGLSKVGVTSRSHMLPSEALGIVRSQESSSVYVEWLDVDFESSGWESQNAIKGMCEWAEDIKLVRKAKDA